MADNQKKPNKAASTQTMNSTKVESGQTTRRNNSSNRANGNATAGQTRTASSQASGAKTNANQTKQQANAKRPTGASANSNQSTQKPKSVNGKSASAQRPSKKNAKTKNGKKRPGKVRTVLRSLMIVLMVAYAVVMLIIGWWGFDNFFAFYFAEKSPVMGVGTESSRVEGIATLSDADIKKGTDAILNGGYPIESVSVRQVGPTIHFYLEVKQDASFEQGRESGHAAIIIFADTLAQPEMFATYEAQIIVSKPEMDKLTDDVLLRPADQDGAEQAFPQYGVSNKHTGGAEKSISWARNGE